jgi:hypothetical protein
MTFRLLPPAALALLAACSNPLSLDSDWLPGARGAGPFGSVLVVAVSEDFDRRRIFENALVDELQARGVQATPSSRTMLTTDVLNRESVGALVKANGADAVLVTRLVHQDVDVKQKRGREVVKVTDAGLGTWYADPYYNNVYTYDFTVTWEASTLEINRAAEVTTDLFETREGKLLYTIRTELRIRNSSALDQNTDVAVMDKAAARLARQIDRDGVIR